MVKRTRRRERREEPVVLRMTRERIWTTTAAA
jgi:hypothetical protein